MPLEFDELARYNRRCAQGIAHAPEYMARMHDLQQRYNEWRRLKLIPEEEKAGEAGAKGHRQSRG